MVWPITDRTQTGLAYVRWLNERSQRENWILAGGVVTLRTGVRFSSEVPGQSVLELSPKTQNLRCEASIGRDSEVDGDLGLGLDRFGALVVRFEMPLLDRFLGGAGQDGRAAEYAQILDQAIAADQSLQNH